MGKKSKKSKNKAVEIKGEVVDEPVVMKEDLDVVKDDEEVLGQQGPPKLVDEPEKREVAEQSPTAPPITDSAPPPVLPPFHLPPSDDIPFLPTDSIPSPNVFPHPPHSDPFVLGASSEYPLILSPSLGDGLGEHELESVLGREVQAPLEELDPSRSEQEDEVVISENSQEALFETNEKQLGISDQVREFDSIVANSVPSSTPIAPSEAEEKVTSTPLKPSQPSPAEPQDSEDNLFGAPIGAEDSLFLGDKNPMELNDPSTTPEVEVSGSASISAAPIYAAPQDTPAELFGIHDIDEEPLFSTAGNITDFDDVTRLQTDVVTASRSPVEVKSADNLFGSTEFEDEPLFTTDGPSTELDDLPVPQANSSNPGSPSTPSPMLPQDSAAELFTSNPIEEEPLFTNTGPSTELDDLLAPHAEPSSPEPPVEDVDNPFGAGSNADDEGDLFGAAPTTEFDDLLQGGEEETHHSGMPIEQANRNQSHLFDDGEGEDWLGSSQPAEFPTEQKLEVSSNPSLSTGVDSWQDADLDLHGVPEGWLDEAGGWNWYTEDERRDVAKGMFPDGVDAAVPNVSAPSAAPADVSPYSPATTSNPFDSYVPNPSARPQLQPSESSYQPAPSGYAVPPAASTYAPALSYSTYPAPVANDAYTPSSHAPAVTNPYAPASPAQPYATTPYASLSPAAPHGPSAPYGTTFATPQLPPSKPASKPIERPKQSTAYDPPLLSKPSRSFLRASNPTPLPIMGMTPSPAIVPHVAPPSMASPPPPPSGPPRSISRQASGLPKNTTYSQPAKEFDPPMPPFAGPTRSHSMASQGSRTVTSPLAHEMTLGRAAGHPVLPSDAPAPPSGIGRSHSMFPQQSGFLPAAPPSQFVPRPSSVQLPQAPPAPAVYGQLSTSPYQGPTPALQPHQAAPPAHPHYRVSSSPPHQAAYVPHLPPHPPSSQIGPTSRSYGIEAEIDNDLHGVSTANQAQPTESSNGAAGPLRPADDWPGDESHITADEVDDFFGNDGPRRDSTTEDYPNDSSMAREEDPEGGAFSMDNDRPFEDDEEDAPGALAQPRHSFQSYAPPDTSQNAAGLSLSPPKPRPPITATTFISPVSQASHSEPRGPYQPPSLPRRESSDPYSHPRSSEGFVPKPAGLSRAVSYAQPLPANDDPYALPHQPAAPAAPTLAGHYEPMHTADPYKAPTRPVMPSYSKAKSMPSVTGDLSEMPIANGNQPIQPMAISDPYNAHSAFNQESTGFSSSYEPPSNLEMLSIEEDPLERAVGAGRRMPAFAFGAVGLVLSSFQDHDADEVVLSQNHGYGGPRSSRKVKIRKFGDVVPSADSSISAIPFPGPLLFDPAVTKGSAAEKKKRERVLLYIDKTSKEIEAGLPYLASKGGDAFARAEQEAKVVLLEIIRLMITHEGKVPVSESSGLPQLKSVLLRPMSSTMPSTRASMHIHPDAAGTDRLSRASYTEASTLSRMLLAGEQEEAIRYAMEEGLWSHALLISSSVGPELWKEVVQRFIEYGFGSASSTSGGEQTLRIAYSMFGGSVSSALDAVLPASPHAMASSDAAGEWRNILCTVLTNGKGDPATISLLGDKLRRAGLLQAAHVCYLLAPQGSIWDAMQEANPPKVTLYGAPDSAVTADALVYSELVEYALSQTPVPKGKDPFNGVPHLLPYKLGKAWELMESGNASLARSYCESISTSLRQTKTNPASSAVLVGKLQELSDRMSADGKSDSTLLKKVGKPNLDSIGSWFEGRLSKFIAGDEASNPDSVGDKTAAGDGTKPANTAVGPFSHYSTITSGGDGNPMARATSSYDLNGSDRSNGFGANLQPFNRTVSAMGHRSPVMGISQIRPSSATGFGSMGFTNIPPTSQPAEIRGVTPPPRRPSSTESGYGVQIESSFKPAVAMPSWGQSYDFDDTANSERDQLADLGDIIETGDFINPMMAYNPMGMGQTSQQVSQSSYQPSPGPGEHDEEDDDLGLGNSTRQSKAPKPQSDDKQQQNVQASKPAESAKPTPQEPSKSTGSGRWLGRWFSKTPEGTPTGPIKAKLGDDNAMVYDKDLKRWIAKGANGTPEAPRATPPPPRAQTASPAVASISTPPPPQLSMTAPPSRPSSAAPPGPPGPRGAPPLLSHQKSTLVSSASTPPQFNKSAAEVAAELMAGPPRKTGSAAGKKKPRYVAID